MSFPETLEVEEPARSHLQAYLRDPTKVIGISEITDRLTAILLGHRWRWQEFEEWYPRFRELLYFPDAWAGLETLPDAPTEETWTELRRFSALSPTAKQLLMGANILTRKTPLVGSPYEIARKTKVAGASLATAMSELAGAGLAATEVPVQDMLSKLKKDELTQIAADHSVEAKGTKAAIIDRLCGALTEGVLKAALPEAKEESWRVGRVFSDTSAEYVAYELKRIRLLAWTVRNVPIIVGRTRASFGTGCRIALRCNRSCPVCREYDGTTVVTSPDGSRLGGVPPFHPGCQCEVLQDFSDLETTIHVPMEQPQPRGQAGCTSVLFLALAVVGVIVASAS